MSDIQNKCDWANCTKPKGAYDGRFCDEHRDLFYAESKTKITLTSASCGNCDAFQVNPQNIQAGECRAEPVKMLPIASPKGVEVKGIWPPVMRDSWCRQFQPRVKQ